MLDKSLSEKVLVELLKNGGDFAELFVEDSTSTSIVFEDNRVEQINRGTDIGAALRLVFDKRTAYAYTNDLTETGLMTLAKGLRSAASTSGAKDNIILSRLERPIIHKVITPAEEISIEAKIGMVKGADEAARSTSDKVRQVKVNYHNARRRVYIANSYGEEVDDIRRDLVFLVHVVVSSGRIIQTGYESMGGFTGVELFDTASPESIAGIAAERGLMMLSAQKAPVGEMMVVLSSEAGGTMVHEAVGHGLEGDFIEQGLSVYSNRFGEKVASNLITIVDDATIPNKRGSFHYDDEGTPAQRTVLIENGIMKQCMHDRLSALKSGTTSTGNGRRQSYRSRPIPRMTNTLIAPGEMNPEEIVRSVDKGLFVKKMGGGEVNIVNGDFVFEVSEGYLIEGGKVTTPIRGAILTGNGPKVMGEIDMVGNDLGFGIGTCGKDAQGAPVSDAQPTLRIPKIIVGGKE
ncbi:MAG: TldD/PmbA family protein [Nitrospinota bacterium]|nr:TldD/PmbA family protein [Nitrospinota bacterium]